MASDTKDFAFAGGLGPVYSLVVLIHVWFVFFFVNVLALLTFGLPGLRSVWKSGTVFGLSVFETTLVMLSALTAFLAFDSRLSYRSAESKRFWGIGYLVNGILIAGLWANVHSLWTGPLDDQAFARLLVNEPTDFGRVYVGLIHGRGVTGCKDSQKPCLSVELHTGEVVAANLVDTPELRPTDVVYVDERVGRFSEETWYEASYVDEADPRTFWRSIVRRYR